MAKSRGSAALVPHLGMLPSGPIGEAARILYDRITAVEAELHQHTDLVAQILSQLQDDLVDLEQQVLDNKRAADDFFAEHGGG